MFVNTPTRYNKQLRASKEERKENKTKIKSNRINTSYKHQKMNNNKTKIKIDINDY